MKRRRVEQQLPDLSAEEQRKLVAHFKAFGGKNISIHTAVAGTHLEVKVHSPASISTLKLRTIVEGSGFKIAGATFDLVSHVLDLQLNTDGAPLDDTKELRVDLPFAPETKKEDETRIDAIRKYATGYLEMMTPANVTVEVLDAATGKPPSSTVDLPAKYFVLVKGWKSATLDQLEVFRGMFPCHIDVVEVMECETLRIHLHGRLTPLARIFRVMGVHV